MNKSQKAFHKNEYLEYSTDELEELSEKMVDNKEAYTLEAQEAWKEVLLERKLDVQTVLRNRQESRMDDHLFLQKKKLRELKKSKKSTRRLGKIFGFLGIPISVAIILVSLLQSHIGGLLASVVFLGCSIWMAFYYEGD